MLEYFYVYFTYNKHFNTFFGFLKFLFFTFFIQKIYIKAVRKPEQADGNCVNTSRFRQQKM